MSEGPRISLPLNVRGVTLELIGQVVATAQELVTTPGFGEMITRINVNFQFFGGNHWDIPSSLDFLVYLEIDGDQHWLNRHFGSNGIVYGSSCTIPNAKPSSALDWRDMSQSGRDLTTDSAYQLNELRGALRRVINFLADQKQKEADQLAHENDFKVTRLRQQEADLRELLTESA